MIMELYFCFIMSLIFFVQFCDTFSKTKRKSKFSTHA